MPKTPCIGVCSTGIGDSVCRGCKRFAQEVINWNGYTTDERRAVLNRLESLLVQTLKTKFDVFDSDRLLEQVRYQQIHFDESKSPYCWLFELLRSGASQIQQIEQYGVSVRDGFGQLPLTELKALVDQEYYDLSCAYHARYILPAEVIEKQNRGV